MDELYDNLENYEDLHIVEQLKTENTELKKKLEEYSLAMENLQKDFDRVSSDFKKLEMNYSSLLKTARTEIEKKTKLIKDLTVEKDMIVLKALQNRNIQDYRSVRGITKPFEKGPINDNNRGKRSTNSSTDNLNVKCDSERKENNRLSSVDTVASSNTDITNRLLKLARSTLESPEVCSDRTSDTKENMTKKDEESGSRNNTRALSVKNRRKSMPAVRPQAKFSSDEEEDVYCRNEKYKDSFPSREDNIRQTDRVHNDRYRHIGQEERNKVSESSSVDDRHSGYEPNRDPYHRNRNEKYGVERHKVKDRYDNQRHRRHLSPERSRWRTRTDYNRQEYGRQRYLESPPPDKFHHYQQRNRESRSYHDRMGTMDHPIEYERRDRQLDKNLPKHKLGSDNIEEPTSKRQRTDSFNKYSEEEKRWVREKGVQLEKTVSDLLEKMPQYTSCQSPDDYLLSDESSPHPVKEIMNTASTPLEDPRTQSKKYILTSIDNNAALSTVTGRKVELKTVDCSKWGFNQVDVPKALTRRPSQCSDVIVKEIYMDIDNPVSNMSAESGEILSCTENEPDKIDVGKTDKPKQGHDRKSIYTDSLNLLCQVDNEQTKDNSLKSTYRIPKIKNTSNQDKSIQRNASKTDIKKHLNKNEQTYNELQRNRKKIYHKAEDKDTPEFIDSTKKSCKNLNKQEYKAKDSAAVVRETIAGDLELSDETSDNTEMHLKTASQNIDKKDIKNERKPINTIEHNKPDLRNLDKDSIQPIIPEAVPEDNKKQRGRKKTLKAKEIDKTDKSDHISDTREKLKKDKKTKFTELFGDSNSLITPEDLGGNSLISPADLGITVIPAQQQSSTKYIPICEDAQDAVDVNVTEKTQLSKPLPPETCDITEVKELQKTIDESKSKVKAEPNIEFNIKKSRNSECDSLAPIENPQTSQTCQDLINSLTAENPVTILPKEAPLPSISEMPFVDVTAQEAVEQLKMPKNLLLKPDVLINALATSTPQKIPQQENSDISSRLEPVRDVSGNQAGADSPADQSSAGKLEKQDTDVPDVRIFVKRRRRVIKKPS